MISNINLNFGSNGKSNPLSFSPGTVTVFVGPNNSGKSCLLREIDSFCNGEKKSNLILNNLEFKYTENEIIEALSRYEVPCQQANNKQFEKINSTKGKIVVMIPTEEKLFKNLSEDNLQYFCGNFVKLFSANFSGKDRFKLVKDIGGHTESWDLTSKPKYNLEAIFKNDLKRKQIREIIYQAFGNYFVIDPTKSGKLQIRFSDTNPVDDVERSLTNPAIKFFEKTQHISQFSDGIQAFTGLILATMVGNEKYIFVDEPEAFLSQNLQHTLGKKLSDLMSKRDGNLIVATHSPYFVMGCIQSGKKVNIVRLTYDGKGNATARLLSSEKVNELFKNPLLRSIGTIQALFYGSVVVTEADADRVFYNEINERLIATVRKNNENTELNSNQENMEKNNIENKDNRDRGISNCLFINAQNKQTIPTILEPLRELGIPAVSIVDIDFLKDGGEVFTKALKSANVPEGLHQNFQNLRSSLKSKFKNTGKCMKKDGGIFLLMAEDQKVLKKFINDLKEYGIFMLEKGELESWLSNIPSKGHGSNWLISKLIAMGEDPEKSNYVHPRDDDVWKFMEEIKQWISDPERKGIN